MYNNSFYRYHNKRKKTVIYINDDIYEYNELKMA